ncbi:MAG: hypothetical protein ACOYNS_00860 [Bacteroidota bacterium]
MPNNVSEQNQSFKQCSLCNTVWQTKDDFLTDPNLRLNGYQFTSLKFQNSSRGGVLLFTHTLEECGTTLAVYAQILKDSTGRIPDGRTGEQSVKVEPKRTQHINRIVKNIIQQHTSSHKETCHV